MQLEIDALKEATAWPGAGLTSAPATESIMGAISRAKAGVGSARHALWSMLTGSR